MDQIDDVESFPPHTQEHAEARSRPSFSRRKAIFVAVSIGVVAAVGTGAALGTKPKQHPAEQASVRQDGNHGVDAAVDEEEPVYQSSDPVMDFDETPTEQDQSANDEEFESIDIVVDVGHSAEHPDDVIYDTGFERPAYDDAELDLSELLGVHETTEEKVEIFDNDNIDLETFDYDGPVSNFIVADLARTTVITTSSTCKNANEGLWKMDLTTDNYPWETYWSLKSSTGEVVAKGPPDGRNYARSTRYVGQLCLKKGKYTMVLGDKNKDGFCCKYGNGKMSVKVNGKEAAASNDQPFSEIEYPITITAAITSPGPNPTKKPTNKPTPKPSPKPSPRIQPSGLECIDVVVRTDKWGYETSYKFVDPSNNNKVLLDKSKLGNNKSYRNTLCLEDGTYKFTVEDPFQGIQSPGFFAIEMGGLEIMYGGPFQTKSKSFNILVGHTPQMTANEKKWLSEHNTYRKEYHEANNVQFRPLVWSPKLAKDASDWVDNVIDNCQVVREPGLMEGENMSVRAAMGVRDEGAAAILARWTNKKDVGYPRNQSMTQVYWYSTRAVGCSEKQKNMANGQTCYVSICRYARAGNCAVGQYNSWQEATLDERTTCGESCVDGTCY